jgi:hypothetical protein
MMSKNKKRYKIMLILKNIKMVVLLNGLLLAGNALASPGSGGHVDVTHAAPVITQPAHSVAGATSLAVPKPNAALSPTPNNGGIKAHQANNSTIQPDGCSADSETSC